MSKKLMIFPINEEIMPLVRYDYMSEYKVIGGVAPKAWGYDGKDLAFIDGGSDLGIYVTDDISLNMNKTDTILLYSYSSKISLDYYQQIVDLSVKFDKELIMTYDLAEKLKMDIEKYNNIKLILSNELISRKITNQCINRLKIPTILVLGAGEKCDKYNIQLALRDFFINKGHKVLQLGTKNYSSMFGFMKLPNFLYESLDFSTKVQLLNNYLYEKINEREYDVLIIGVPGGLESISLKEPNWFGELALVTSNAVNADISIMSLYKKNYTYEILNELSRKIYYKLNCPFNFFHISNKHCMYNFEERNGKMEFLIDFLPKTNLRNSFNIYENENKMRIFEEMYNLLIDAKDIVG